jgi:hypothetical protein
MDCPRCLARTYVSETRKRETYNAWVNKLKKDWPDVVYRRRRCSTCNFAYDTVELPVSDFKQIAPPPRVDLNCDGDVE